MTMVAMLLQEGMLRLSALLHREDGQDGVEYAVVAALVIVVVAAAYSVTAGDLQADITKALDSIASQIP